MAIPLDTAELFALFLETLVYGIFFSLCSITCIVLTRVPQKGVHSRRIILPAALLMLALATAVSPLSPFVLHDRVPTLPFQIPACFQHLIIDLSRAAYAFLDLAHDPGSADAYFGEVSNSLFLAKSILYFLQTLAGDSVIIWRCYVVMHRRYLVIIPPLSALLGTIVFGCIIIARIVRAPPGATIFVVLRGNLAAYMSMTMSITAYCTAAICWQIYQPSREWGSIRILLPVLMAIVESGALYTASVLTTLILFLIENNAQFTCLDIIMPLVGVVYCLIILQIRYQTYVLEADSVHPRNRRFAYSSMQFSSTAHERQDGGDSCAEGELESGWDDRGIEASTDERQDAKALGSMSRGATTSGSDSVSVNDRKRAS
ncbi:hypothetical protein EW146_g6201 [Bondarzewia mesenterica]|uniref:Uncharacterized protein n=1 Tax=Bondarzewia mesenterica TaxID=1095465 RepID=A0A4S4LPB7_9AGAM|nr:hypothetical protein EW146_g6201 [Bondarzewia mesenterica]